MPLVCRKDNGAGYDRPCEKASGCVRLAATQNERVKERVLGGEWLVSLVDSLLWNICPVELLTVSTLERQEVCALGRAETTPQTPRKATPPTALFSPSPVRPTVSLTVISERHRSAIVNPAQMLQPLSRSTCGDRGVQRRLP